jgi:DNA-binding IclR family transcriptional regulator
MAMVQEREGTVARVAQLLRHLAEGDDHQSVTALAQAVSLPPSTVHRLLQLLKQQGMVQFDPATRAYGVGMEFYRLSAHVVKKVQIPAVARPFMVDLVSKCNETCLLGIYLPAVSKMMFAEKVDPTHPVRYVINMHRPSPLVWGATGRAILAFLPPAEIQKALAEAEPSPVTGETPQPQVLQRELAEIRSRWYAVTAGQKTPGAVAIAAPIFGPDGTVGDLCLTIPQFRYDQGREQELASLLVGSAMRLSVALGWKPSPAVKFPAQSVRSAR